MGMQVGGRSGSISTKNLPAAAHTRSRPGDPQTLVVVLSADGTAVMGASHFPSAESLGPALQLRLATLAEEDRIVYVKVDASLAQGSVQKVLEFCREADAGEIALITSPRITTDRP